MKKILSFSMILFLVLSGVLIINASINNYFNKLLYHQEKEVSLQLNDNADYAKLTGQLQKVATGNTSVSQYFFTDEKGLIIYSANSKLPIAGDKNPGNIATNYSKRGERLLLPNTQYRVKLYPFYKIKNLGLNNVFYVRGNINKVTQVMRNFGKVKVRSSISEASPEINNTINFVTLALLSGIVSLISLMFVSIKERQAVMLRKLFGHHLSSNVIESIKNLSSVMISALITSAVLLTIYSVYKNCLIYYQTFILRLAVLYIGYLFLMILLYSLVTILQAKFKTASFNWSGASMIAIVVSILAFVACVLFVSIKIPEIHQELLQYQKQTKNLSTWSSAKNIYQTNVTNQLDRTDNKTEVAYDISAKRLWHQLSKRRQTFIVSSNNLLGAYNSSNQLVPWYTIDPDNSSVSDYIVSPSGRAITADINYLKLSKTKLLDGYQVSRLKPTLFKKILIVPEKYKHYEAKIRSNYLTEFLFQLNSDFKEWKRTEHTPKFTRKNLKIEIIYAKNGQKYFTYNPNSGDNLATNMVKDPIITVFDGYQNSLSYGNLFALNGGFFFFDRHVGEAYERIQPLLRKSGMDSTINYVTSIYAQKSKLIQQTKNAANTALTQIVVFGIITFLSLAVLINQYYLLREKEIIIKRFMGFPLRTIMFIPVAFISIVFILSNVISIYLAHTIDWLSLSESALIFLGTILMSFIIVLYDIKKRNRTIGRDS